MPAEMDAETLVQGIKNAIVNLSSVALAASQVIRVQGLIALTIPDNGVWSFNMMEEVPLIGIGHTSGDEDDDVSRETGQFAGLLSGALVKLCRSSILDTKLLRLHGLLILVRANKKRLVLNINRSISEAIPDQDLKQTDYFKEQQRTHKRATKRSYDSSPSEDEFQEGMYGKRHMMSEEHAQDKPNNSSTVNLNAFLDHIKQINKHIHGLDPKSSTSLVARAVLEKCVSELKLGQPSQPIDTGVRSQHGMSPAAHHTSKPDHSLLHQNEKQTAANAGITRKQVTGETQHKQATPVEERGRQGTLDFGLSMSKQVLPQHSAVDREQSFSHTAADREQPLSRGAPNRERPLSQAAADREQIYSAPFTDREPPRSQASGDKSELQSDDQKEHGRLFIVNLAPEVSESDLKNTLSLVGPVLQIRRIAPPRNYAFVTMASHQHAVAAIKKYNGFMYKGLPMVVKPNHQPPPAQLGQTAKPVEAEQTPAEKMMKDCVLIANLPQQTNKEEVIKLCSKYGVVQGCVYQEEANETFATAVIKLQTEKQAAILQRKLHGNELYGSKLLVKYPFTEEDLKKASKA